MVQIIDGKRIKKGAKRSGSVNHIVMVDR